MTVVYYANVVISQTLSKWRLINCEWQAYLILFLIDNNSGINFVFPDECTHPVGACFLNLRQLDYLCLKKGVPTSERCVDHDDDNSWMEYLQVPQEHESMYANKQCFNYKKVCKDM